MITMLWIVAAALVLIGVLALIGLVRTLWGAGFALLAIEITDNTSPAAILVLGLILWVALVLVSIWSWSRSWP